MSASLSGAAPLEPLPEQGRLFLAPASERASKLLRGVFDRVGFTCCEPQPGVLMIQLCPERLEQLVIELVGQLTAAELCETKCLPVAGSAHPSLAALMRTQSLQSLVDQVQGHWLSDVLRDRSLVTFFQPIVPCRAPRQVFAYECLIRGRHADGSLIYPNQLYNAARATGQLPQLDRAARLTAIATAAQRHLSTHVFINFNPRSIDDPTQCLRETVAATRETNIRPQRFVFEVVESDQIDDIDRLIGIMDHYRQAGFQVALDDLGAGYGSLTLLTRLKPDFIKLDMDLIRNVDRDPYKGRVASKLLELARELRVSTVVEGVETLGEWQWAYQHGADYAQGYYFARPDAVPWLPAPLSAAAANVLLPSTAGQSAAVANLSSSSAAAHVATAVAATR